MFGWRQRFWLAAFWESAYVEPFLHCLVEFMRSNNRLLQASTSPFSLHRPTTTREARLYLSVLLLGILSLNILGTTKDLPLVVYLVASAGLFVAGWPMWHFLSRSRDVLPFFPIISILYGVYFIAPILLPVDPYFRLVGIPQDIVIETLLVSVLGISVLVFAYAGILPGISLRPRRIFAEWSVARAKAGAVVLGPLGMLAEASLRFSEIPTALQSLFVFTSNLSLLSIGMLYLFKLQNNLSRKYSTVFWLYLFASALFALSTGVLFPLAKLALLLLLIYLGLRRQIPWKFIGIGMIVLLPLLAFKSTFRQATWEDSKPAATSVLELPGQLMTYSEIITSSVQTLGKDEALVGIQVVVNRADLLHLFSYYRQLTPETIPYLGGTSYASIMWKFIPRMFYPDKPAETLGQDTGHLYGVIEESDLGTSVNFAQLLEMYLNFGIVGVVIGMYLLAQVYRVLSRLFNQPESGVSGIVPAALIFTSISQIESNFSLIFGGLPYTILLLYLVMLTLQKRKVS